MTRSFENIATAERQALAVSAIQKARLALQHGDRRQARRYAEQAVTLAPNQEDPWLLLAALASPRASLDYLQRALQVNPASQRARKGMQWAMERLQVEGAAPTPSLPPAPVKPAKVEIPAQLPPEAAAQVAAPPPSRPIPLDSQLAADQAVVSAAPPRVSPGARTAIRVRLVKRPKARPAMPLVMVYAFMLLCLSGILFAASLTPYYIRLWNDVSPTLLARAPILQTAVANLPAEMQPPKFISGIVTETPALPGGQAPVVAVTEAPVIPPSPTLTVLPPDTATPVPTATPLPTETPLPTAPPTELPTASPTPLPPTPVPPTLEPPTPAPPAEPAPQPTKKVKKKKLAAPDPRPANIQLNDNWIDVDLSSQTVFAMQGNQVVRSFVVSTGRWPTVTVTGTYRIYVKYRAADMSGDDYYLPDVPYVMYFFKGYGLHGTYWHNNFGTPMSHGCVNLSTPDAGWLFEFASVGTTVRVHD